MADDDVTIGITVEDADAMAKLREVGTELTRIETKAEQMRRLGFSSAPVGLGGARPEAPPGFVESGGKFYRQLSEEERNAARAADEFSEASGRAGINIGSMMERIAVRLVIFEALRLALGAVKDAVIAASQAEEEFRAIQVGTQGSIADTNQILDSLKKTADDTGQDLEKSVIPAFNKLFESGMGAGEAAEAANAISIAMQRTKIDITGVVEKAEQGAASFGDMAKAGRALGDAGLSEWARSWAEAQVAETAYTRELSHAHELMQRQIHDVEALASAHEGFAQKTGLAAAAFKEFAAAGARPTTTVHIPAALADLPGGERAFGQLLGEMQKRFQEGMAQIGKEEGLAPKLVRAGVAAQLPGFGEADLLAAAKRAEQEKALTAERKEQDTHAERIKAFDDARVSGNEKIKQLLADETKNTNDLAGATKTLNDRWNELAHTIQDIGIHAGDVSHEIEKTGPMAMQSIMDKPTGMAMWDPHIRSQMDYWRTHPEMRTNMPGGPGAAPGGGAAEIKETNSDKIEGHLRRMADALTGHGTP